MIPNISGGGDTGKRIAYLIGKGHRGEHENPHLIGSQGWEALPEKGPGELLDKGDVKSITGWLDEALHLFGKCPRRRTLERIVSEAGKAARDEIDFVSLLRAEGLRVKPRFVQGGVQVVGYSVAFKGPGEPWFGGTRLGHDLKLTAIRAAGNWRELNPPTVAEAWNNPRARSPLPAGPELLAKAEVGLRQLRQDLAKVDPIDQVTWAHAARDTAAILNTWSLRVEPTPGPIAQAAYTLRASATIHRMSGDRRRWLAAQAGRDACNALLRP